MEKLLPIMLLVTIVGAVITLFATPKGHQKLAGPISLVLSLIPLVLTAVLVLNFQNLGDAKGTNAWQFQSEYTWLPVLGLKVSLGLDAISLWLVVLTAVLTPISILASFNYIKERQPEFYAWMLLLHAGMLGVFAAKDLLVFYLFFEFTLIPMFFIIGIWGGAERRKAAGKFFLFTFAGSVLTLASLLYISYLNSVANPEMGASFALADLYAQSGHINNVVSFLGFHIPLQH